jgi:hypothetical protein
MYRQFADQPPNRVRAEIEIGQLRIAAHGHRRILCRRQAKVGR